jgi:hypothetical protein
VKRGLWLSAIAVVGLACSTSLPSREPLGEGPLAKAEAVERAKAEAEAEARAASSSGSTLPDAGKAPKAPKTPSGPSPTPTAVASAEGAEAGADAGAAGADAAAPTPPVLDIAGEYVGSDISTISVAGQNQEQKDDKARTRVEVPGPGEVNFTFVASNTGTDICTLKAKLVGKTATLTPGQSCWTDDGGGTDGTLTRGTATFTDKRLVIDADFDLSLSGGMSGSLVYHFDGTKN